MKIWNHKKIMSVLPKGWKLFGLVALALTTAVIGTTFFSYPPLVHAQSQFIEEDNYFNGVPQFTEEDQYFNSPTQVGTTNTKTTNPTQVAAQKEAAIAINCPSAVTSPFQAALCWMTRTTIYAITGLMALLVSLAGMVLDGGMYYTVNMRGVMTSIPVVDIGWTIFRDFANMFFIFVLLYIAVATILNIGNTKKMLVDVLITALLINFSLFFCKAFVDGTNLIATFFYDRLNAITETSSVAGIPIKGPSATLFNAMNIQTTFATQENNTSPVTALGNALKFAANPALALFSSVAGGMGDLGKALQMTAFNVVIMLIAMFVLATGGLLLFVRIVVLMFLMMLSPLAVVARILPRTQKIWNEWLESFVNHAIWAPAYLALMYIAVQAIGRSLSTPPGVDGVLENSGTFMNLAAGDLFPNLGTFFNYLFMVFLLVGVIFVSKRIGISGAGAVQGWATGVGNWTRSKLRDFRKAGVGVVGRHTVGRAARRFEEYAETSPFWNQKPGAKARELITQPLAGAKFGGSMSAYEMKKKEKARATGEIEAERLQALMAEANKGKNADPRKLEDLALRLAPQTLAHTDMRYLEQLPIGMLPDTHWQALMASDKVQKDKDKLAKLRLKPLDVVVEKIKSENLGRALLQKHPELAQDFFDAGGLDVFLKNEKLQKKIADGQGLSEEEKTRRGLVITDDDKLSEGEGKVLKMLQDAGINWTDKKQKEFKPAFEFLRAKSPKELGQLNRVSPETINTVSQYLNWGSQISQLRKSDDITFDQRNGQDGNQLRDFKDSSLLDALSIQYGIDIAKEQPDGTVKTVELKDRYKDFTRRNGLFRRVRQFGAASIENPSHPKYGEFTDADRELWQKMKEVGKNESVRKLGQTLLNQHHEGRSDAELTFGRTYQRNDPINFATMGAGSVPALLDRDNDKKEEQGGQLLTSVAEDQLTEENKEFLAKVFWDRDADKYLKNWQEIARRNGYENNPRIKKLLEWKSQGAAGKKKFMDHVKTIKHTDFYVGSEVKGGTDWDNIGGDEEGDDSSSTPPPPPGGGPRPAGGTPPPPPGGGPRPAGGTPPPPPGGGGPRGASGISEEDVRRAAKTNWYEAKSTFGSRHQSEINDIETSLKSQGYTDTQINAMTFAEAYARGYGVNPKNYSGSARKKHRR